MNRLQALVWLSVALLLCVHTAGTSAKVFEINWEIPQNGLILPSVSTAKCGDIIRFRCPAKAKHGVFRMPSTNHNGSCPDSFTASSEGEVLSAPAKGCDFNLTLGHEPDFFVTSHAPGDCEANLKMNVHIVCVGNSVSASDILGKAPRFGSLATEPAPGSTGAAGRLGLGLGLGQLEAGEQTGQSLSLYQQQQPEPKASPSKQGNSASANGSLVQLLVALAIGFVATAIAF